MNYPEGVVVPDLKNKMGIYVITNIKNDKKYVG